MSTVTQITKIQSPARIATSGESFNWDAINLELDMYGAAVIGPLLSPHQCKTLISEYDNEDLYRSRVVMARHGFGQGEYKYFAYPLPSIIAELRKSLYPYLMKIANRWNAAMGIDVRYPAEHEAFKARCNTAGQTKPTPLIQSTKQVTITVCIRTSTANTSSRCKLRSCCQSRGRNLQAASLR